MQYTDAHDTMRVQIISPPLGGRGLRGPLPSLAQGDRAKRFMHVPAADLVSVLVQAVADKHRLDRVEDHPREEREDEEGDRKHPRTHGNRGALSLRVPKKE